MYRNTRPVMGLYISIHIIVFFFLTIIRIFNQKNFIWETEKLHMTTWDTSRVFCSSDITSPDPTPNYQNSPVFNLWYHIWPTDISIKPNLIQTYPTRSRLPIFLQFIWNPKPHPIRNRPPEFDPTANYHHLLLSIPWKPRLYTAIHIQTTENNPRTRPYPRFRVSTSQDISRFFHIETTSPDPLKIYQPKIAFTHSKHY
jgi:hypothetical protein